MSKFDIPVLAILSAAWADLPSALADGAQPNSSSSLPTTRIINLAKDPQHAPTVAELEARLKQWLAQFARPVGEFTPRRQAHRSEKLTGAGRFLPAGEVPE